MSFAAFSPAALAALAALTGAAVVLLYLLRRSPRAQLVSNVDFWLRAAARAAPRWPFSWRIPLRSLLVSLLVALGLVALIGDPRFGAGARTTTVLVFAAGRGMNAVGLDGEPRLARARREALRWAEHATIEGELAVIRAGMRPSTWLPLTADLGEIETALGALVPDEGGPDLEGGVRLAEALLEAQDAGESGEILVVTDAPWTARAGGPRCVVLPVGTPAETLGWTAFSARRVPFAAGEYVVRAEVHAWSARDARARLVVRDGDVAVLDTWITVPARSSRVFEASGFSVAQAALTAELEGARLGDAPDGLPSDDRAYAVVEPLEATRVLLVDERRGALDAALHAHPGLVLERMTPAALAASRTADLARFRALVLEGQALPAGVSHPGVLRFAPLPGPGVREGVARPPITGVLSAHPALDGMRLEGATLARATPLVEAPGDEVLLRSADLALAVARVEGVAREAVFGFVPEDADFVRSEAFPLLVHGALGWVAHLGPEGALPLRLGAALEAGAGRALVAPRAGGAPATATTFVPEVARAGLWHEDGRAIAFGGTEESGPLGAGGTGGTFAVHRARPLLSTLVAIAVLALLLLEWVLVLRGRLR